MICQLIDEPLTVPADVCENLRKHVGLMSAEAEEDSTCNIGYASFATYEGSTNLSGAPD